MARARGVSLAKPVKSPSRGAPSGARQRETMPLSAHQETGWGFPWIHADCGMGTPATVESLGVRWLPRKPQQPSKHGLYRP